MAIPVNPQSYETLKARFPECLKVRWDAAKIQREGGDRPGLHPEYVFDTLDGLRLIVSVDTLPNDPVLHISASMWDMEQWRGIIKSKADCIEVVFRAFKKLAGLEAVETGCSAATFSSQGVVHFVYPLDPALMHSAD
jgi:hypothetical protein